MDKIHSIEFSGVFIEHFISPTLFQTLSSNLKEVEFNECSFPSPIDQLLSNLELSLVDTSLWKITVRSYPTFTNQSILDNHIPPKLDRIG
ncbi:MAG: hypothetical protein HeimC2_20760 [Candidatus Heimdallarchaeota archaeon LC_2]|nr:MAG: hypothetical protein HeimC2_20760 [Candidatus Heimdallarchaeota archaeon LC_2]